MDGYVIVYNGIRYSVLFGSRKYNSIYNTIKYLISAKSGITYFISHNYAKIKVNSYDSLPLEKTKTFQNYKQKIIQVIRRNQVYFSFSNVSTDTKVIVKD